MEQTHVLALYPEPTGGAAAPGACIHAFKYDDAAVSSTPVRCGQQDILVSAVQIRKDMDISSTWVRLNRRPHVLVQAVVLPKLWCCDLTRHLWCRAAVYSAGAYMPCKPPQALPTIPAASPGRGPSSSPEASPEGNTGGGGKPPHRGQSYLGHLGYEPLG